MVFISKEPKKAPKGSPKKVPKGSKAGPKKTQKGSPKKAPKGPKAGPKKAPTKTPKQSPKESEIEPPKPVDEKEISESLTNKEELKYVPPKEELKLEPKKPEPNLPPKKEESILEAKKPEPNLPPKKEEPKRVKGLYLMNILFLKKRIYSTLNFPKTKSISGYLIAILAITGCIFNALAAVLETVHPLFEQSRLSFIIIVIVTGVFFSIEYILRIWTADLNPKIKHLKIKQFDYAISLQGLIDLIAVLSFVFVIIVPFEQDLMNGVRMLRIIVLLKLNRYSKTFDVLWAVIKRKREELIMTLLLSLILLFFGAVFIYYAEHDAQPEKFTNLFSSMWYAGTNLFTIGYGDLAPVTVEGKIVSGILSFLGVSLFILPVIVFTAGFVDELQERNAKFEVCPNCKVKILEVEDLKALEIPKKELISPNKKIVEKTESVGVNPSQSTQLSKNRRIQRRCFELLENKEHKTLLQKIVFFIFIGFIGINCLMIMVESNPRLSHEFRMELNLFYLFSIIVFSIEYSLRFWSCPVSGQKKYQDPKYGRYRYMATPLAIIDLSIILIYLIGLIINISFLQMLKVFILFKLGHFTAIFDILWDIFKEIKKEFFVSVLVCGIFLLFSSTVIYSFEHDAQPDKLNSIPATMWLAIITFTTVGLGDVYPITTLGRFYTICFAFGGILLFYTPGAILGAGFFSSLKKYKMHKVCPKCGFILSTPKFSQ